MTTKHIKEPYRAELKLIYFVEKMQIIKQLGYSLKEEYGFPIMKDNRQYTDDYPIDAQFGDTT